MYAAIAIFQDEGDGLIQPIVNEKETRINLWAPEEYPKKEYDFEMKV